MKTAVLAKGYALAEFFRHFCNLFLKQQFSQPTRLNVRGIDPTILGTKNANTFNPSDVLLGPRCYESRAVGSWPCGRQANLELNSTLIRIGTPEWSKRRNTHIEETEGINMNLGRKSASLFLLLCLAGCGRNIQARQFAEGDLTACRYDGLHELSLTASAADRIEIRVGSGDLMVEGREGLDEVRVTARTCASDQRYLDRLRISLERAGNEIVLTAHYPGSFRSRLENRVARIDLIVEVPLNIATNIRDSAGSIQVSGLGALRIHDGSGDIDVENINGKTTINDASGDLNIEGVAGDLEVHDGSGGIGIRDIAGRVLLSDGSGSIDIDEVALDVVVERDGSGSISVNAVGGDFNVRRDGSGGIQCSEVDGRVRIPRNKR